MPNVWDSGPILFPIGFIGMKTTGKMAWNNNNAQHPTLIHYFKAHLELYILFFSSREVLGPCWGKYY